MSRVVVVVGRRWRVWRDGSGLGRRGALLDDPDVEDAGEHQGAEEAEPPPVLQEDHEDEGDDGQEGAQEVEQLGEPAQIGGLGLGPHRRPLAYGLAPEAPPHRPGQHADVDGDHLAGPGYGADVLDRGGVVDSVRHSTPVLVRLDGVDGASAGRPAAAAGDGVGGLLVVQARRQEQAV